MRATILAVGSELLSTERLDTNSLRLAALLEEHGVELVKKSVVGDLESDIGDEIATLWRASDLVLVTGGIGPTADDRTREGAARALGLTLSMDEALVRSIEERFASVGRRMSPISFRTAGGSASGPGGSTTPLPRTGTDATTPVAVALLALTAGFGLLAADRRRRMA